MMKVLVPSMPTADEVLPYLRRIDGAKWYTNFGPLNAELEDRLEQHVECPVVTVANATLGLELAIREVLPGASGNVLCPSWSFQATATAIIRAGHIPVFADVDLRNHALSVAIAFEACARMDIHAVVPVCPLGHPIRYHEWQAFHDRTGIPVVIDAAAAFGNLTVPGTIPAVFSMHATKSLGAGEGGFVASRSEEFRSAIRLRSNFGLRLPGGSSANAYSTNAKLSEYHAAVALASLDAFPRTAAQRKMIAGFYHEHDDIIRTVYQIHMHNAPGVISRLERDYGIPTRRWYCPPLHTQFNAFPVLGPLRATDYIAATAIGLPFHTGMGPREVSYVLTAIREIAEQEAIGQ